MSWFQVAGQGKVTDLFVGKISKTVDLPDQDTIGPLQSNTLISEMKNNYAAEIVSR